MFQILETKLINSLLGGLYSPQLIKVNEMMTIENAFKKFIQHLFSGNF